MTFCQHSSRGSCPEYVAVNQVKAVLASCLYGFGASTAQVAHCFDEVDHLQKFAAVPMFAQEAESKFPYGQDAGTDMKLSQQDPHTHGGTITPPKAAADSRDSQLIPNGVDIGTALHPDSGDVRPSRCFSAPPRELCRRYKRAGFCKYGDRCFYRHDVSQCKRFESKPASPPPDVVSFGATCIVPDYTASIPMSNAPTPMFYNISTESEPKTPTSRSSVGDSLPAVPFFPDFHTSEEDAYNATSAAIDVEEAPRAQTIDEESLSSSSLFDGTYAEDGFICPAREWCTFETLAVDSNVRNELFNPPLQAEQANDADLHRVLISGGFSVDSEFLPCMLDELRRVDGMIDIKARCMLKAEWCGYSWISHGSLGRCCSVARLDGSCHRAGCRLAHPTGKSIEELEQAQ